MSEIFPMLLHFLPDSYLGFLGYSAFATLLLLAIWGFIEGLFKLEDNGNR